MPGACTPPDAIEAVPSKPVPLRTPPLAATKRAFGAEPSKFRVPAPVRICPANGCDPYTVSVPAPSLST
ncbi:hypothetical protein D3C87_1275670 [compost metagenome]